jgi:hypothetical protein
MISEADAQRLVRQCQVGVPRGPEAYDRLHGLLAQCYGTIGSLLQEREKLLRGEFICTRCGLRKDAEHGTECEF